MRRYWRLFLGVISVGIGSVLAGPQVGDSLYLTTFYRNYASTAVYELKEAGRLDSITISYLNPSKYFFSVKPTDIADQWTPFIPSSGIKVQIMQSKTKPEQVVKCNNRLANCTWITGIQSNFPFIGTSEFYFPILPLGTDYEYADSFTVRINDTIGISFEIPDLDTGESYVGTMISYSGRSDHKGTKLNIPNAIVLGFDQYAMINPLRFQGICANSLVKKYVNFDMSCCGEGYYGMLITKYTPVSASSVRYAPPKQQMITSQGSAKTYDLRGAMKNGKGRSGVIINKGGMSPKLIYINK